MRALLLVLCINCMLFINPTLSVATDYDTICVESDTTAMGVKLFGTYIKKDKQTDDVSLNYYSIVGSSIITNIVFEACAGTGYDAFNPDLCFCILDVGYVPEYTKFPIGNLETSCHVWNVWNQAKLKTTC